MKRTYELLSRSAVAAAIAVAVSSPARADHAAANPNYGTPVHAGQADREIRISSGTRWANVMRNETVRFVVANPAGEKSFIWKFDTLGLPVFDLNQVAPEGTLGSQRVTVYVGPGASDISGGG
jgi:hypothetical protein